MDGVLLNRDPSKVGFLPEGGAWALEERHENPSICDDSTAPHTRARPRSRQGIEASRCSEDSAGSWPEIDEALATSGRKSVPGEPVAAQPSDKGEPAFLITLEQYAGCGTRPIVDAVWSFGDERVVVFDVRAVAEHARYRVRLRAVRWLCGNGDRERQEGRQGQERDKTRAGRTPPLRAAIGRFQTTQSSHRGLPSSQVDCHVDNRSAIGHEIAENARATNVFASRMKMPEHRR